MDVDRGAAGAAFATPILSVGTACRTNKIRGWDTKKMSQKRDEIRAKIALECMKYNIFFFSNIFRDRPFERNSAPFEAQFRRINRNKMATPLV